MIDLTGEQWIAIQNTLQNAHTITVSDINRQWTMVIFSVGPFKIAYPDFICGRETIDENYVINTVAAAKKMGADVIRFQGGHLPKSKDIKHKVKQGTIKIKDLNLWKIIQPEKAKRTRNKSQKTKVCIRKGTIHDGATIYNMYLSTIKRHNGNIRYNQEYFTALSPEAAWVATIDDIPCAFICIGFQGQRGVYLHGGHETWSRKYYSSDLLYLFMLDMACARNMTSFDFLPSPKLQHSLWKYKESWGGENTNFEVTDMILNPLKGQLFILAMQFISSVNTLKNLLLRKLIKN